MAETNLTEASTRKRVLKSQFTKYKGKIDIETVDLAQAELILEKCRNFRNEFKEIFSVIYQNCEETAIDDYIEEEQNTDEKIDELYLQIVRKTNSVDNKQSLKIDKPAMENLKLPKLTLPTFTGNITEWITFKDLFIASVHENKSLSDCQRLQYLKTSLKSDALRIVQSISIADQNYMIAWNLLEERFSNKREQLFAQIKRLLGISPIQTESSASILNLVDNVNEITRSIELTGQTIENFSDVLITYIILQKLDSAAMLWWERHISKEEIPTLSKLLEFLKDYARTLQNSRLALTKSHRTVTQKTTSLITQIKCPCCSEEHYLSKCSKFLSFPVTKRLEFVKTHKLCFNCCSSFHKINCCKSNSNCRYCAKRHNSLLHFDSRQKSKPQTDFSINAESFVPKQIKSETSNQSANEITHCASSHERKNKSKAETGHSPTRILLCTALIKVSDSDGVTHFCRCLLDCGSESSFIRKSCADKMGLEIIDKTLSVSCLGNVQTQTKGQVELIFSSRFNERVKIKTVAYVIDKITGKIPNISLPESIRDDFNDLTLADPEFHKSSDIDILLGVNVFLTLLNGDVLKRNANLPFAISSKLGWIISGKTSFEIPQSENVSVNHSTDDLVRKFWELEQIPSTPMLSKEETLCENYFEANHAREKNGRYCVKLPFKIDRAFLGDSKTLALKKFLSLEKRLVKNTELYQMYREFMSEYVSLGHMQEINENMLDKSNAHYYIPHHPVIKESSLTTKLRVVFNASSPSSSGASLNDILMNGPKVQDNLFDILLRFRCHPIAITADFQKMYRQIYVDEEDRNFQKILWRSDPTQRIKVFQLKTVTYGTTPASYLATRVIKQLALDEGHNFPEAANVLLKNCYVDDVLCGSNTVDESITLITQLCALLQKGKFTLHKWSTNSPETLAHIVKSQNSGDSSCNVVNHKSLKVLGVEWHPQQDDFTCDVSLPERKGNLTKRQILSDISKIFDPLGWLAPFTIAAKILLQTLWKCQISWDDPVPEEVSSVWNCYLNQLHYLTDIRIPRRVVLPESSSIELHGFCDASVRGYSAVIYVKSVYCDNSDIRLLASKTRVAPLKVVSIPRLELCSAVLLSHLVQAVNKSLQITLDAIYAWTDSQIVLSWLQSEPTRWQTFVANRVSEVQTTLPVQHWHHVKGEENPADCASRGIPPLELLSHKLWWSGPEWLNSSTIPYPAPISELTFSDDALKESRKQTMCTIGTVEKPDLSIINKFSSYSKLKRVLAWIYRFAQNSRNPLAPVKGFLSNNELMHARNSIVRLVQKTEFSTEYSLLSKGNALNATNKFLPLNPFLDEDGIIRVGGRLKNSNMSYDRKFPILLPRNHKLSELIVTHFHKTHLHAAPLLLLSVLRREFWIVGARSLIRQICWKCLTCHRTQAKPAQQVMSDLPASRVNPSRVFSIIGIDFAGPFFMKSRQGRGIKSVKGYICVFVCFATKAVHLELVSNLTSDAFLAAFKRFVSRRGKPNRVYSDCGTNFVAASKELKKVRLSLANDESVAHYWSNEGINWHFNPPSAPHFGGLWEAAVKSAKLHLKKVIGEQILTLEEFSTLLAQVESCLNSRPLCPLSDQSSEFSVLTPGHFLIGVPMTELPQKDLTDSKLGLNQRWKLLQQMYQHFWKRWSNEYLSGLQRRSKWCKVQPDIKINDLVLIKEDNMPPLKWKIGRVLETYPGTDNHIRVVQLKTPTSIVKRPIHKLSVLPISD